MKTKQEILLAYLAEKYPDGFTSLNLMRDNVVRKEIGFVEPNHVHTVLYRLKRAEKISATGEWGSYVYKLVGKVTKDEVRQDEAVVSENVAGAVEPEKEEIFDMIEETSFLLVDVTEKPVAEKEEEEIPVDLKLFLTAKERRAYDQLLMLSKAVLGKEERRFNAGQLEQFHDGEREDFLQKLIEAGVIIRTGNDSDTVPGFPCYRIVEKFYLGLINRIEIVLPRLADQVAVLANELAVQKIEINEIEKREMNFLARCRDFVEQYKQLLAEKERLDERLKVVNELLATIATGLKNDKSAAEELGEKRRALSLEFLKKNELHNCLVKIGSLPEAEQALLRSMLTGE